MADQLSVRSLSKVLRFNPDWFTDPAPEVAGILHDLVIRPEIQVEILKVLLDTQIAVRELQLEGDRRRLDGLSQIRKVLDQSDILQG